MNDIENTDIVILELIPDPAMTGLKIMEACESLAAFLLDKNEKYGDAALNAQRIFSKADESEGLLVRIDDKLSRIKNSDEIDRDDITDLAGYLILLLISKGWEGYDNYVEKLE